MRDSDSKLVALLRANAREPTASLARKLNLARSTVAEALKRLKQLGMLNWLRRCSEAWEDGRFTLKQDTNAYAVLPASHWLGYREPPPCPAPHPATWGATPSITALDQAIADARLGMSTRATIAALESDAADALAAALARLGRHIAGDHG